MSAFGTKRTSLVALHISAFGGKADIPQTFQTAQFAGVMSGLGFSYWGVTLSCASKSWTYIVWKVLAVIRKLEVAFSRKASTMTRRRERSLPKAQNPSNAQVQNWSFA